MCVSVCVSVCVHVCMCVCVYYTCGRDPLQRFCLDICASVHMQCLFILKLLCIYNNMYMCVCVCVCVCVIWKGP